MLSAEQHIIVLTGFWAGGFSAEKKAINLMTLAGPVDGPEKRSRGINPSETAFFFYRIFP